ncbi:peptide-methionine (R)-S-oxide reductase MsrB [Thorsellia anophelis]|uniref:Multifunctional fusion protein n=1 Tax=Thorsellia anophelis DSM 18579 TaxID=1123402 RepID=A0A1H9YPY5_9GAMM|nr:peptide methionine sulfoxide reductase msrA/msrB [Thorsellia anophelis DSM 18579]
MNRSNSISNRFIALLGVCILSPALYFASMHSNADNKEVNKTDANYETSVLAGGCFWCTEADMEKVPGVIDVVSGYSGGTIPNPTYDAVSSGTTGHIEVIEVTYDPSVLSYEAMLDAFLRGIDPTDDQGSFVDRGPQYRPAIFYKNEQEKQQAASFLAEIDKAGIFKKPLKTELIPFDTFYVAEEYHQDYYINNPLRYRYYRHGSGRDQYLDEIFGPDRKTAPKTLRQMIDEKNKLSSNVPEQVEFRTVNQASDMDEPKYFRPSDEEIKQKLNDIQYKVTQKDGTERPFDNPYWDNEEAGIYVDIVSGEPLFSSTDKYDSGTGWPSFTKPIDENFITTKEDNSWFATRIEVRSKFADSHLGHVFDDGPAPTGLRYCMNSASMLFIPKDELAEKGYGKYSVLFENQDKAL